MKQGQDIIELICENRGVDFRFIDDFLNPGSTSVEDPLIYLNLDKLCLEIINNIDKRIAFVVDSDVDGYCSAAMLINYLCKNLNMRNFKYILHDKKTHGLTNYVMEQLCDVDCVIIADASSEDFVQHKILKDRGIQVLVIDHHEVDRYSEDAIVVNNQLQRMGNKTLSGAGMVMKVLERLDTILNINGAWEYLDLCATALIGDCMPMTVPETRFYALQGIKNINNQLLKEFYDPGSTNFEAVSFDVVPAINAFIRIGSHQDKRDLFDCLLEKDFSRELEIRNKGNIVLNSSKYIKALSGRMKSRQTQAIKNALDSSRRITDDSHKIQVVILAPGTEQSLTGLIANRLTDEYNCPVLTLKEGEVFSGSARSVDGVDNFKDILINTKIFNKCAGHQGAFGVEISKENFKYLLDKIDELNLEDYIMVDKMYNNIVSAYEILKVDELKNQWCKGFDKPKFYIRIDEPIKVEVIGQKRDTIRFSHRHITYIKFKCSKDEVDHVLNHEFKGAKIIGTFNVNDWNDRLYPQIFIDKMELDVLSLKEPKKIIFGGIDLNSISW